MEKLKNMKHFNFFHLIAVIFITLMIGLMYEAKITSCEDLDANCDGEINIVDMSIFLAKAEQVTHYGNSQTKESI